MASVIDSKSGRERFGAGFVNICLASKDSKKVNTMRMVVRISVGKQSIGENKSE